MHASAPALAAQLVRIHERSAVFKTKQRSSREGARMAFSPGKSHPPLDLERTVYILTNSAMRRKRDSDLRVEARARVVCSLMFLFVAVHLPALGVGQKDDSLFAEQIVFSLDIMHNRTSESPTRSGPNAFPSFTWASHVCAERWRAAAAVTSDSAGNFFAAGNGMICKYGHDGKLDWARTTTTAGARNATGEESHSPRLAIGKLKAHGENLYVPGARGEHAVFFTSDEGLHAIDVETGNTLWRYGDCGAVHGIPLVVQTARCKLPEFNSTDILPPCSRHMVVFGEEDDHYYALTFNGTLLWTFNMKVQIKLSLVEQWPLRFTPAFGGNRIFLISGRGLAAVEVDGSFVWRYAQKVRIHACVHACMYANHVSAVDSLAELIARQLQAIS